MGLGRSTGDPDSGDPTREVLEEEATTVGEDFEFAAPSALPRHDALNNNYVRIVHINGIHYTPLVYCDCRGITARDTDLMFARLVPTSFVRYRTLFTTAVLDDFRLSNLECKASAYQYWQKLSRMTSAATSPADIDSFYRELLRLSRCWRWLKKLKWAGRGGTSAAEEDILPGELAIFCPTCPQPGVNLPPDWKSDVNKCVIFLSWNALTDWYPQRCVY